MTWMGQPWARPVIVAEVDRPRVERTRIRLRGPVSVRRRASCAPGWSARRESCRDPVISCRHGQVIVPGLWDAWGAWRSATGCRRPGAGRLADAPESAAGAPRAVLAVPFWSCAGLAAGGRPRPPCASALVGLVRCQALAAGRRSLCMGHGHSVDRLLGSDGVARLVTSLAPHPFAWRARTAATLAVAAVMR